MTKKIVTIYTAVFFCTKIEAQEKMLPDHTAIWTGVKCSFNIKKTNLFVASDMGYRRIENRNVSLVRSGIGWQINNQWNIINGVAWFRSFPSTDEFRLFHYINYTMKPHKIFLHARIRIEERWIEKHFFLRNGILLGVNMLFPKKSNKYKLTLYNEYLHHLNNDNFSSTTDQNRIGLAIEKTINNNNRFALSFIYQKIEVLAKQKNQFYVMQFSWNTTL